MQLKWHEDESIVAGKIGQLLLGGLRLNHDYLNFGIEEKPASCVCLMSSELAWHSKQVACDSWHL